MIDVWDNLLVNLEPYLTNVHVASATGWPTEAIHALGVGFQIAQLPSFVLQVMEEVRSIRSSIDSLALELKTSPTPIDDGWLDSTEAASYLSMAKTTFEKHLYKGKPKIKAYMVGGKNLFKKSDLDRWVMTYKDKSDGYF